MSVEVEIYMSNIIKFFKQNEPELLNLVPKDKEEEFYKKIREVAFRNYTEGGEASLTQKQMIEICVHINGGSKKKGEIQGVFQMTKFGNICLN